MRCHYGSVSMQKTLCRAIMSDLFNVMYGYQFVNLCQILPETNALPVYKNFETLHSINTITKNNNNSFQQQNSLMNEEEILPTKLLPHPLSLSPISEKGSLSIQCRQHFIPIPDEKRKKQLTVTKKEPKTQSLIPSVQLICSLSL